MSSATFADLLQSLDQGIVLLLPSERAAREVNSAFDDRQRASGLPAWEPAQALSWPQWTRSLWSQLVLSGAEHRLLLNPLQEHELWRQAVSDYAAAQSIASIDSLAELAHSAWRLAAAYRATSKLGPFRQRQSTASQDSRIFAGWADSFARLCAQREVLSPALLEEALAEHLRSGRLVVTDSICLVGFSEKTPAQQMLLSELQDRHAIAAFSREDETRSGVDRAFPGAGVTECDLEATPAANGLRASVVASTEPEELLLAARWIRQFLETAQKNQQAAHVAILLPDMARERSAVEAVLRQTLAPELQSIDADLSSAPWEFSSGPPLSSLSLITDALELVRWTRSPLSQERVSSLLLSPHVGENGTAPEALDEVARFDLRRLRRLTLLCDQIKIHEVLEQAARVGLKQSSAMLPSLRWLSRLQDYAREIPPRAREYADWMESVRELVRAANWPGSRPLTAAEFAAVQAWESALDTVSTLDFSGRRVPFEIAWQALEFQLQRTSLLPAAPLASVRILSPAEAEGSVFDAIVLLRCTDANWPESEQPHPLLPWALQRSLGMPGVDPAATAARSRRRLERLLRRTGNILFTHAGQDENGKLRPSPLLQDLQIKPLEETSILSAPEPANPSEDFVPCETVADNQPPAALPSHEVGGGASVLRLQAACGFLAFAQLRLGSNEVERRPLGGDLGLDAGESGSLVHRTLQIFWNTVKSQDNLRRMSQDQRRETLTRSIEAAIPSHLRSSGAWEQAYLSVLQQRLCNLLSQWLEQELRRGPFQILAVERQESISIGPLTLDLRIDRIDTVQDGIFLVDYKTGAEIHTRLWEGDRPDDPQLPLYALLPEAEELKGLAFAWIRAGTKMNWVGYQAIPDILPTSKPGSRPKVQDMAPLQAEWRQTLTRLAERFAEGRAEVLPKSYQKNCMKCAQRLLCRINQTNASGVPADTEEEMEEDEEENGFD
ncbi:MAG: PD-(D/E)XK nuclease family protein [Acidobacteriota bacterium]